MKENMDNTTPESSDDLEKSWLDNQQFSEVISKLTTPRTLEPNEVLINEGDIGSDVYFVREGSFEISIETAESAVIVASRGPGTVLGESQLLAGGRRTATVRALERSTVLVLKGEDMDALLLKDDQLRASMASVIGDRLRVQALQKALPKAVGDNNELISLLTKRASWLLLKSGETLCEIGESAESWYVLVSGELTAHHGPADSPIVGTIRRGEVFGELSLLRDAPRAATLVSRRTSWVACFDQETFKEEVLQTPAAVEVFFKTMAERIAKPQIPEGAGQQVFALIPRDPDVDRDGLARDLEAYWGKECVLADAEYIEKVGVLSQPAALPEHHPAWLRFEAWLESRRQDSKVVLLVGDNKDNAWTRTIIDQSDIVLLLADSDSAPEMSDLEKALFVRDEVEWLPPRWLVLEHPPTRVLPKETHRWLDARRVEHHAHLRRDHGKDIRRLARWLSGEKRGLALSGGGSRGFVHLGVLQALRDEGIEIDLIAGTSAGAMAGGLMARDEPARDLTLHGTSAIQEQGDPFKQFQLPVFSLLKNSRLRDGLQNTFGEACIEDSWIPLRIVVTDLSAASRVVFKRGPVWHRAFASASPPGLLEAVIEDDRLLCDGGLVDNLPVSVLIEERCSLKIASNVSSESMFPAPKNGFPVHWRVVMDKILSTNNYCDVPTLPAILMRSLAVPAISQLKRARAASDLVFDPDLSHLPISDFGKAAEMFETGESHAREVLASWPLLDETKKVKR
jgi:NTE family protein